MVICVVNSEFAVARRDMYLNALLRSLLSPRDTFFRDRSDPEGRRYRTKEAKQKKAKKKKKLIDCSEMIPSIAVLASLLPGRA